MRKISQRQARWLKKRVKELEQLENARRRIWTSEYPGVHLGSMLSTSLAPIVQTARRLNHYVVVTVRDQELQFYGSRG